ncbi:hypothetical protein GUJ93_ZPchr0010g8232 [Zizania palustris]|uniref:Uncharacterized protein n=1 Tax=Zizania palustris TaxID=103762 RepID=A0A8J6BL19_ZIZPA|nr:hypothetical protein GUJ93_ZPchr0010g8232 [Zizania palustris]
MRLGAMVDEVRRHPQQGPDMGAVEGGIGGRAMWGLVEGDEEARGGTPADEKRMHGGGGLMMTRRGTLSMGRVAGD